MIVVTTVGNFIDIDGYACDIAYSYLLNLLGRNSVAVPLGPLNSSVTKTVRGFEANFEQKFPVDVTEFVVMDMSDPIFLSKYLDINKVIEIYDHRAGNEQFWSDKIKINSHIEMVGSCSTLVWEKFTENNLQSKISQVNAKLLATAILSNTLNFKSNLTTDNDTLSYKKLLPISGLNDSWPAQYFLELEEEIYNDPELAVKNDTKFVEYSSLPFQLAIGQIELWNSRDFIERFKTQITDGLKSYNYQYYFLTSPSINEGVNYIYAPDKNVQDLLTKILNVNFIDEIASTDHLIQRKEILKLLQQYR